MKMMRFIFLSVLGLHLSCSSAGLLQSPYRSISSDRSCDDELRKFISYDSKVEFRREEFSEKLRPIAKIHQSGKKYLELTADLDIIENDSNYAKFLNETVEIIYFPSASFGHVKLRVANMMYDFKGVTFVGIQKYHPKMKKNQSSEAGPMGFIFKVGADKIKKIQSEVEMMYLNSSFNNIPPYDLYSSMIKIEEREFNGQKYLIYASTSPAKNLANKRYANGKIIKIDESYYLESDDGYRVDAKKMGDDFYIQSYSCLSVAIHVLEKYFNIILNYGDFPPGVLKHLPEDLQNSIIQGNHPNGESPAIVINYF